MEFVGDANLTADGIPRSLAVPSETSYDERRLARRTCPSQATTLRPVKSRKTTTTSRKRKSTGSGYKFPKAKGTSRRYRSAA